MSSLSSITVHERGTVTRRQPGSATAVATGPRCALVGAEVVCTFMVQSSLGVNDFVPMIARSNDGGRTWRDERMIWPELRGRWSLFGSVGTGHPDRGGELMFFGSRCPVTTAGESDWCEATHGLRQNELFWARSSDGGHTWSAPAVIPMAIVGAAEAAGPMCVTREDHWLVCYAPYHTFDPTVKVDRNQLALMRSEDRGATWTYQPLMRFANRDTGSAEAWVIELADGRLLSTCWHVDHVHQHNHLPNPYALSPDGGRTWRGPRSTGIFGHSTGLAALPDGRAIMVYNQRQGVDIGVHLAIANPRADDFGLQVNQCVWSAGAATQHGGEADHGNWVDFSFGEPAALVLPDGEVLVVLWCIEPAFQGIRWVRIRTGE